MAHPIHLSKIKVQRPNMSSKQEEELTTFLNTVVGFKAWHVGILLKFIDSGELDFKNRWAKVRISKKYSLEWFQLMFGETAGVEKYNKNSSDFKKSNTTNLQYWISKGFSEKEATDKIDEILKKLNSKSAKTRKGKMTVRHTEYWINKGYSQTEAIEEVKKIQSRGEEFFINKYGEDEGKIRHKTWKINKAVALGKASKPSRAIFDVLKSKCEELKLTYYYGIEGNHELYLLNPDRNRYPQVNFGYDFAIPTLRLVFEFNGKIFHPKTRDDQSWCNPYRKDWSTEFRFDFDSFKQKVAADAGYRVEVAWYDDDMTEKVNYFISLINEEYAKVIG